MCPARRSGSRTVPQASAPGRAEPPKGLTNIPPELTAIIYEGLSDRDLVNLTQVSKDLQSSLQPTVSERIRRNTGQDLVQNTRVEMSMLRGVSPAHRLERWDALKDKANSAFQPSQKIASNTELIKNIRMLPQEQMAERFRSALPEVIGFKGRVNAQQLESLIDTIPELPEKSRISAIKGVLDVSKEMTPGQQAGIHRKLARELSVPPDDLIPAMMSIAAAEVRQGTGWTVGTLAPLLEQHIPKLPPANVLEGMQIVGSLLQETSDTGRHTPAVLKQVIEKMTDTPAAHQADIADLINTRAGHLHEERAEVRALLETRLTGMRNGGWFQKLGDLTKGLTGSFR